MSSESWLRCSYGSSQPSDTQTTSVSQVRWETRRPLEQCARCTCTHPCGWNHSLRGLSWHWAVLPWQRGNARKVKIFLLLSSMHFWIFLPQQCVETSLLYSRTSIKELLSMGDCQNQCSMREWQQRIPLLPPCRCYQKAFWLHSPYLNDNTRPPWMMQKPQNKLKTTDVTLGKEKQFLGLNHYFCCCSAAQLCPTLFDAMDCNTPGFPVPHHLRELAQTHVHWVSDAIQPFHPLSTRSPPSFNLY